MHLCPERALRITEYFKKYDTPADPMILRKAKAFRHLMSSKSAIVYADELIAGNMGVTGNRQLSSRSSQARSR